MNPSHKISLATVKTRKTHYCSFAEEMWLKIVFESMQITERKLQFTVSTNMTLNRLKHTRIRAYRPL